MTHFLLSDVHLYPENRPHPGRERFLRFLNGLAGENPGTLWILGDLFDYWFEYATVMPAGYGRVLRGLRNLADRGWKTVFMPGNHDWWVGDSFQADSGMEIRRESPLRVELDGKRAVLAHGDGLGRGDRGYRAIRPVLRAGVSSRLFSMLHPTPATALAMLFSGTSRRYLRKKVRYIPDHLRIWAEEQSEGADLVVTGHTHVPLMRDRAGCRIVSLGDWIGHFTYLKVGEGKVLLERYGE